MSLNDKIKHFNQRWEIFDENEYVDKFNKFKLAVLNIFSDIDFDLGEKDIEEFCNIHAIKVEWKQRGISEEYYSSNIINSLSSESEEKQFYYKLQTIFWFEIKNRKTRNQTSFYFEALKRFSEIHEVNLALTLDESDRKTEVILYPKGEKQLDKKLIDPIFSFLNPTSAKKFKESLCFHEQMKYLNSAESLRRSLEEFLKFKLNNDANFKTNIGNIGSTLKDKKIISEVRNLIIKDLDYLDKLFNNHSKHGDGKIEEAENEFLLYQIALIMRYISKVL